MSREEFSRRNFLKAGGAGIAGTALLGISGCGKKHEFRLQAKETWVSNGSVTGA